MKRLAIVILPALALLAVIAPAGAKELRSATICGPQSCHEIKHRAALAIQLESGSGGGGPKGPAAYYRVHLTIGPQSSNGRVNAYYVPSVHAWAFDDGVSVHWSSIGAAAARALEGSAGDLATYPPAGMKRLFVPYKPRVTEVFEPAAKAPGDGGGGFPWIVFMLAGAGAIAVALVVAGRRLRGARLAAGHQPAGR